jgi:hypothetical protein
MKSEILAVCKFAVEAMNNVFKITKKSSSEPVGKDAVIQNTLTQAMWNSLRQTGLKGWGDRDPSSGDFDEPGSTI